jgi:hypothetical protein
MKGEKMKYDQWHPIETAPEYTTVLVYHAGDLYPTVAFRINNIWLRDTEGPEETTDKRCGKYEELYHVPTHWMPLPTSPNASGMD